MERLLQGVAKFQRDVFPHQKELFEQLANNQEPHTLFITCADSRIVPQLITQSEPGELFICRNAGNMIPSYGEVHGGVSATIEYAVSVLNVRQIIVCGHSDCGAMKGILHPEKLTDMPTVKSWLQHGELARRIVKENYPNVAEEDILPVLTAENVVAQLQHLQTHPSVAARLARGQIGIHGWVYHIHTGRVDVYDSGLRRFLDIGEYTSRTPDSRPALAVAS